jgi:hypothetical protein
VLYLRICRAVPCRVESPSVSVPLSSLLRTGRVKLVHVGLIGVGRRLIDDPFCFCWRLCDVGARYSRGDRLDRKMRGGRIR